MAQRKLLTVVGMVTFWLCFSSLWATRAAQRLDLPLNVFKDWAAPHQRASDITMIAIYLCWPGILATWYLMWQIAIQRSSATSRWQRLPAPFDAHHGLRPREKTVYRLFFLLLLWLIPIIHAFYFAKLFFQRSAHETAVFHWNGEAWLFGEDSVGKYMLYGGLTYFGWTPVLVIIAIIGMLAMNIFFVRAVFRKSNNVHATHTSQFPMATKQ